MTWESLAETVVEFPGFLKILYRAACSCQEIRKNMAFGKAVVTKGSVAKAAVSGLSWTARHGSAPSVGDSLVTCVRVLGSLPTHCRIGWEGFLPLPIFG